MTFVFICLLATGQGLLVLTSILDDFLGFLFDGVTPALATGLGATGAIGLIGVSLTGLTDPVLMAVAASVGLASAPSAAGSHRRTCPAPDRGAHWGRRPCPVVARHHRQGPGRLPPRGPVPAHCHRRDGPEARSHGHGDRHGPGRRRRDQSEGPAFLGASLVLRARESDRVRGPCPPRASSFPTGSAPRSLFKCHRPWSLFLRSSATRAVRPYDISVPATGTERSPATHTAAPTLIAYWLLD